MKNSKIKLNSNQLSLRWFSFYSKILLFIQIAFTSVMFIINFVYVISNTVLITEIPIIFMLSILYLVWLVILLYFLIVTRSNLISMNKKGYRFNRILIILTTINMGYSYGTSAIIEGKSIMYAALYFAFMLVFWGIVYAWPNMIYFNKRKDFFN